MVSAELLDAITEEARRLAIPISATDDSGYNPVLELAADARFVLLGEASHGTHEFYAERTRLTKRLITDFGFNLMAIEGDWPEAHAVNQFILGGVPSAEDALRSFGQYPTWMWANRDILEFVTWLRDFNSTLPSTQRKVRFLGLDVYSPFRSLGLAADMITQLDPAAGRQAQHEVRRFQPLVSHDREAHQSGIDPSFEDAIAALEGILTEVSDVDGATGVDDPSFLARHSLDMARAGFRYYPLMHEEGPNGWNLRDTAMADALDSLLAQSGPDTKVVVWQHNAHVGDFRGTAGNEGLVNLGQLVRERHPDESVVVGFGTYTGTVTAGAAWGGEAMTMEVPPAREGSYDELFHRVGMDRFLLMLQPLRREGRDSALFTETGQRAIGAVNDPAKDDAGYTRTRLAERYDAYVHIDHSQAVEPLG